MNFKKTYSKYICNQKMSLKTYEVNKMIDKSKLLFSDNI